MRNTGSAIPECCLFPVEKIATYVAIPSPLLNFCYSKNTACLQAP